MSVNLSQWIGVIGAAIGGASVGIATYYIEKFKIENNTNDQRTEIYSQLRGAKVLMLQSYTEDFDYPAIGVL